ncbi:MAG: hypothetical protein ACO1SV_22525 [Fimbriimonas sp.]
MFTYIGGLMVDDSERALAELSYRLVRLLGSPGFVRPLTPDNSEAGTLLVASILRDAVTAHEPWQYLPLFASTVSFSSPAFSGVVQGRDPLHVRLREALEPLWEIDFGKTYVAEGGAVLRFRACVNGTGTDGVLLIQLDRDGRIGEFVLTFDRLAQAPC